LVNVALELGALAQLPEIVAAPPGVEVALQVEKRTLATQLTPPCGMVKVEVPMAHAHKFQLPFVLFAVQVAAKVNPLLLTVHPVRVGGLATPQIGAPEAEDCALKVVDDPVQVTVAVPSVNRTVVPEHNEAVVLPVGETESADAAWAQRPSTAATKPRLMRICVAFILRLLWGWTTRRRDRKRIEKSGVVWVLRSIRYFEPYCKIGSR
jgi:hypothetical protein